MTNQPIRTHATITSPTIHQLQLFTNVSPLKPLALFTQRWSTHRQRRREVISFNAAITACSVAVQWQHALALLHLGAPWGPTLGELTTKTITAVNVLVGR